MIRNFFGAALMLTFASFELAQTVNAVQIEAQPVEEGAVIKPIVLDPTKGKLAEGFEQRRGSGAKPMTPEEKKRNLTAAQNKIAERNRVRQAAAPAKAQTPDEISDAAAKKERIRKAKEARLKRMAAKKSMR